MPAPRDLPTPTNPRQKLGCKSARIEGKFLVQIPGEERGGDDYGKN